MISDGLEIFHDYKSWLLTKCLLLGVEILPATGKIRNNNSLYYNDLCMVRNSFLIV